jgi:CBS domain-containing protein
MTIGRVIAKREQSIVQCSPELSVREAAQRLAEHRIGALPVMEGSQVAGIFSERDLLYCVAREGEQALGRKVREVMTSPPITVGPEVSVLEAFSLMTRRRVRHLPVVADGRMIAFVSIGDLVKHRLEEIENEAQAMREYIRTA